MTDQTSSEAFAILVDAVDQVAALGVGKGADVSDELFAGIAIVAGKVSFEVESGTLLSDANQGLKDSGVDVFDTTWNQFGAPLLDSLSDSMPPKSRWRYRLIGPERKAP